MPKDKSLSNPQVSVVMAVYNERSHLEEAVQSILNQTFEDYEFIIINDGSTDGSREVLERFADQDSRIRLVHQENQGLALSLNRGISMASGRYVARMDGDDVSYPQRFERQVRFLRGHPEVGVLGTKVKYIDVNGQVNGEWPLPTDPDEIAWHLLFNNCLAHSSVMARRAILEELNGYAEWMPVAQDYELWTRVVNHWRITNLPVTLLKLRRHEGSVTVSGRIEQIRLCGKTAAEFHRTLLGRRAEKQVSAFLVWMDTKGIDRAVEETGIQDFPAVHSYLRELYGAFARRIIPESSSIGVRQHSLAKLDKVAKHISKHKGWAHGLYHKVRARFMAPVHEILPWGLQVMRRRIS